MISVCCARTGLSVQILCWLPPRSGRCGCAACGRAQQSIEKGKIINLMSADIENVNEFIHPALGQLLVLPLTIIVAIVLLYLQIGCASALASPAAACASSSPRRALLTSCWPSGSLSASIRCSHDSSAHSLLV